MTSFVAPVCGCILLVTTGVSVFAQAPVVAPVRITADNFNRAETDANLALRVKRGAFGKFYHSRELPLENAGVRTSRDTLYSEAVFDLDAGPVKITLPNAGKRFMSMIVINEDHYVYEVDYGPGNYNFTKGEVGTRYVFMALRTMVDPNDPQDVKQARALQDAVIIKQKVPAASRSRIGIR
jgi:hypothetical protein